MNSYSGSASRYLTKLMTLLSRQNCDELDNAISIIADAWQNGKQIIVLGNGGSALTALHFCTDWSKMITMKTGKPFLGRTLLDNIGLMTAYANDVSYADIFVEQLKIFLQPGDLVLAISCSGNSENVVRAIDYANKHDAITLGLCGYRGGKVKALCQHVVWVDIDDMQLSEDMHSIFGHMVMQTLCGIAQ